MHLRALKTTQIVVRTGHQQGVVLTTETGMLLVQGPMDQEDGTSQPGQVVVVEEGFVVNPDVWEVVTPSQDNRTWIVLPNPVKGVNYVQARKPASMAQGFRVSDDAMRAELDDLRETNAAMQKQLAELTKLLRAQTKN